MTIHTFQHDLAFTERARQLLVEWLYPGLSTGPFISLSGLPGSLWLQRHAHIDGVLGMADGSSITIKEKIVNGRNTYLTLETLSNVECRTPGWIVNSTADWLVYTFAWNNDFECYVIELPQLQRWFKMHAADYDTCDSLNRTRNGAYRTRCAVIPIRDVEGAVPLRHLIFLECKP